MISKKIVLLLSLCAAGSMVPLQAAPCVSGSLLSTYIGSSCEIGLLSFAFADFKVIADGANTTPAGGLTASDVQLITLMNTNGTGFLLAPTTTWAALGAGTHTDSELTYVVTGVGINRIYLEVDGSASPGGYSHVVEQYCLGGTASPPAGDTHCPGDPNLLQHELNATITNGTNTSASNIAYFSDQTSISVLKDIDVNGGPGGGGSDSAQITGVINQFGPYVPEPATYGMSIIGLGLMFLGKRRFSRS